MTLAALGAAPYLVGIGLLVAAPALAEGQRPVEIDALTASPKNFTRLLDNDHVRVLEYVLEPGQQDLPHTHPPKASYVLSGGMFEVHPDGATTFVVNESTGETSWSGFLGRHYVKNPGTSTVRVLLVEDKPASGVAVPPVPSVARTLGQPTTAKNHKILLENAFVRVVAVTVAAKRRRPCLITCGPACSTSSKAVISSIATRAAP